MTNEKQGGSIKSTLQITIMRIKWMKSTKNKVAITSLPLRLLRPCGTIVVLLVE